MHEDFLGTFLGNQARAKLARVFVFNELDPQTLKNAAKHSGLSIQAVAREAKAMEKIGIIKKIAGASSKSKKTAKKKLAKKVPGSAKQESTWILNPEFKHLRALSLFIHEVSPPRYGNIVATLKNCGRLSAVVASGCFMGDTTRPVDLMIVVDNVNENRLEHAIKALEPIFGREIRYASFSTTEFSYRLTIQDRLIRDTLDYPHQVLLDRTHLLQ